mgnify:CR=1 FL=1
MPEESWRANNVRPYGIPFQEPRDDVGIDPYDWSFRGVR